MTNPIKINAQESAELIGIENVLIVPKQDSNGVPTSPMFFSIIKTLLASAFGGYTVSDCVGGWVDPEGKLIEEQVWKVAVSFHYNDDALSDTFFQIAEQVKDTLKQNCVYVRLGDHTYLV